MRLAHEIPHPRLLTLTLCALAAAAFYVAVPPHANAKPARHQARPQLVEEPSVAGIINGASVTDAAWSARWQSAVGIWSDDWLMCGGTLIDAQTVVTAAHCTFDESNRALTAQHMRISIGRVEHSVAGGDMIQVERIVRHPRFDRPRVRNDIAILRLTRAPASGVSYATVEPVSRADSMWWQLGQGWATSGDLVGPFIAGWGTTTPRGRDATPRLREAKVPVASDQSCGASSAPGLGRDFDPASMICAVIPATTNQPGVDACVGDSGGPLIVGDGAGSWRLVGITSWGYSCAGAHWAAYTRVGAYTAWIDQERFAPPTRSEPLPESSPGPHPAPPLPPPPPTQPTPPAGEAADSGGASASAGGASAVAHDQPVSAPASMPKPAVAGPVIDDQSPTRPARLWATAVRTRTVTLRWSAARDDNRIAHYELQWLERGAWRELTRTHRRTQKMHTLTPGARYQFRVRAMDEVGNYSGWSRKSVYMQGDVTAPSQPGAPRATISGRGALSVRWRRSRDLAGVKHYLVLVQHSSSRRWKVAARPRGPHAQLRGLRSGSIYRIQIRALDHSGNSSMRSAPRAYIAP